MKSAVSGNDAVATMQAAGSLGTVTTRLMHAPARTGLAELVLKLVLCTLSAASLLCKPQTKPPRSAKRRACGMPVVKVLWPLGLYSIARRVAHALSPVCEREAQHTSQHCTLL